LDMVLSLHQRHGGVGYQWNGHIVVQSERRDLRGWTYDRTDDHPSTHQPINPSTHQPANPPTQRHVDLE
jgi:hypothetical protein